MTDELDVFLQNWTVDACRVKELFQAMYDFLRPLDDVRLEYKARPGVSHSLRAYRVPERRRQGLFVLLDVIDDDPAARWLSICFYADLTSDPAGLGDTVPGGLLGEDALCFDLEGPEQGAYILERLAEAYAGV